MKFRFIGGSRHVIPKRAADGKTFTHTVLKKGDVIESEDDLVKKFPNVFEVYVEVPKASAAPPPPVPAEKPTEKEETNEGEAGDGDEEAGEEEEGLGVDVTGQFKKAVRADLKVFKKDGRFSIADADEPGTALDGASNLKDKNAVNAFINSYLAK